MQIARQSSRRWSSVRALAVLCALTGCARIDVSMAAQPQLELRGNVLYWNGQPLRFQDRVERWTAVLGTPPSGDGARLSWPDRRLDLWTVQSSDGRAYVKMVHIKLGKDGFPGVFSLQGVPIRRGTPSFKEVEAALADSPTPIAGLGQGILKEGAKMTATGPDGFELLVSATLYCREPSPPPLGCEQVIDMLELVGAW